MFSTERKLQYFSVIMFMYVEKTETVFSLKFQSSYYMLIDISLFKIFSERSLQNANRDVYIEAVNTYNVLDHLYIVELHKVYVRNNYCITTTATSFTHPFIHLFIQQAFILSSGYSTE